MEQEWGALLDDKCRHALAVRNLLIDVQPAELPVVGDLYRVPLRTVEGNEELRRIHHASDLLVDRVVERPQVECRGDDAADLAQRLKSVSVTAPVRLVLL